MLSRTFSTLGGFVSLKRICSVCRVQYGVRECAEEGESHGLCHKDECLRYLVGDDDTLFMEVRNAPSSEYPSAE